MRVLVTRALEDARSLAAELAADGIDSVLAPMLSYEFLDPEADAGPPPAAYIITSRNGAEALARYTADRSVPVYAVGDATAERLRAIGFAGVESAAGDARDLLALVSRRMAPDDGPMVFLGAEEVAADMKGALGERGYDVRRIVAYRSVPALEFPPEAEAAMRGRTLDGVLFFSPKTGRSFAALVEAADLAACCNGMTAYCISAAVAETVAALPWSAVRVAERPTKKDLLGLLSALCNKGA